MIIYLDPSSSSRAIDDDRLGARVDLQGNTGGRDRTLQDVCDISTGDCIASSTMEPSFISEIAIK